MAIRITLRKKTLFENWESLYLDFYPYIHNLKTGEKTRREFLNMYLHSEIEHEVQTYNDIHGNQAKKIVPVLQQGKPKVRHLTPLEKQHNKSTWEIAEKIRQRREKELNSSLEYSELDQERLEARERSKGSFIDYFKELADQKYGSHKESWNIVYKYLKTFTKGKISFYEIDEKFCADFKSYLLHVKAYNSEIQINQNTASSYFTKFKFALKQAFRDKKIQSDINPRISAIKTFETQRDFLTLDELNKLVKTFCFDPMLKRAFLFSCLTGLRKGDILNLVWGRIERIENMYVIRFRQQKTKGIETLWISDQAYDLLGEPGKPEDKVFPGLKINSYYTKYLYRWMGEAGIKKNISFHNARHTMATLQASLGTDPFTLMKRLGHKDLKNTLIYVKAVDKLSKEAADRIKLDM